MIKELKTARYAVVRGEDLLWPDGTILRLVVFEARKDGRINTFPSREEAEEWLAEG